MRSFSNDLGLGWEGAGVSLTSKMSHTLSQMDGFLCPEDVSNWGPVILLFKWGGVCMRSTIGIGRGIGLCGRSSLTVSRCLIMRALDIGKILSDFRSSSIISSCVQEQFNYCQPQRGYVLPRWIIETPHVDHEGVCWADLRVHMIAIPQDGNDCVFDCVGTQWTRYQTFSTVANLSVFFPRGIATNGKFIDSVLL